jgi:SAM-dependent methyltransferase
MEDGAPAGSARTSAELRHLYNETYYVDNMAGAQAFRAGATGLATLTNVRRAFALMLAPRPRAATDLGAGRGELARHLLDGGARVTVLDYSEAAIALARGHIGSHPNVAFVVADAASLLDHVEPASQDAIFMTDVVEHISSPELRQIFAACRQALAPGGVLCVHTPERHYGTVVTKAAVHPFHINLFDIDSLRELLADSFEAVESFTWNGTERHTETGRSIELFALGRAGGPYATLPLPLGGTRVVGPDASVWVATTLLEHVELPDRFLLRASLHVVTAPAGGSMQVIFATAAPDRYFWTGFDPAGLAANPAELLLASELTNAVNEPRWADVERIVLRFRRAEGGEVDIRISDLRMWLA